MFRFVFFFTNNDLFATINTEVVMVNIVSDAYIARKVFETRLCVELKSEERGAAVVKRSVRVANIFQRILRRSTKVILDNKVVHLNSNSLRNRLGSYFGAPQILTTSFQAALDSMSSAKKTASLPKHDQPATDLTDTIGGIEQDLLSVASVSSFGSYKSCESLEDFMSSRETEETNSFNSPMSSRAQALPRALLVKKVDDVAVVAPVTRSFSRPRLGVITSSIRLKRTPAHLRDLFDRNLKKFDEQKDLKPIRLHELGLTELNNKDLASLVSVYNKRIKCPGNKINRFNERVKSVVSEAKNFKKDVNVAAQEKKTEIKRKIKRRLANFSWKNRTAIANAAKQVSCTNVGSFENTRKVVAKAAAASAIFAVEAVGRAVEEDDLILDAVDKGVDAYRAKQTLEKDIEKAGLAAKARAQELIAKKRSSIIEAQDAILNFLKAVAA